MSHIQIFLGLISDRSDSTEVCISIYGRLHRKRTCIGCCCDETREEAAVEGPGALLAHHGPARAQDPTVPGLTLSNTHIRLKLWMIRDEQNITELERKEFLLRGKIWKGRKGKGSMRKKGKKYKI
jgi:hypothetical protein